MNFKEWLSSCCIRLDEALDKSLPLRQEPIVLHEAMRYASIGAGKRFRAALVYASGLSINPNLNLDDLDAPAQSVELIHAYSLVHDDLPCMDNDELRRGKPTVHIQYGYANALLVGDALQAKAFEILAQQSIESDIKVKMILCLSEAAGSLGMCGGQWIDMNAKTMDGSIKTLEVMHRLKTGTLIEASVLLGGYIAQASEVQLKALQYYAHNIGLAFQVMDDILDVTSSTQKLGKTSGKDQKDDKMTYVSVLGLEKAKEFSFALYEQAVNSLKNADIDLMYLDALAQFVIKRTF